MNQSLVGHQNYHIRPCHSLDRDRLHLLAGQLGYTTTPEQIQQRLERIQNNPAHHLCVVTLNNNLDNPLDDNSDPNQVIGWAQAQVSDLIIIPKQAILFSLVVDSHYRHQGIGKLLMQHIEQWAKLQGCEGVMLYSNRQRQEAHLFYEAIGYTPIKQSLVFAKPLPN